ncbi:MAG: hypothetical protein Q8896_14230, partial [Bacteroidota bacterium]|nr:hypothetical protein [Bacteroidota bacterium]
LYCIDVNGTLSIDNTGIITGSYPTSCGALLELSSISKGFLTPRMTTGQRNLICGGAPPEGLIVYNTTTHTLDIWNGSSYAQFWDTKGNAGTNPVTDFLGTTDAQDLIFRTTNTERARILAGGNVAIGAPSASARLQVNEGGVQDGLDAIANGTGRSILGRRAGGSGITLGQTEAIRGDNTDGPGVAGTSNTAVGLYGTSAQTHGVWGVGVVANAAGVEGRNDVVNGFGVEGVSLGSGTGVHGVSQTGNAGSFQITNAGSSATVLNVSSAGTGSGVSITTPNSNNLLVVNGSNNATVANVAADPVWDSRINGDQLVTGIQKIGGSIWLDGTSGTHQIVTDAPVNIGTKNVNNVNIVTNNTVRETIDGSGNVTDQGNLNVNGSLTVGSGGSAISKVLRFSVTLGGGTESAQTAFWYTITLPGVAVGDPVFISGGDAILNSGSFVALTGAWVSAANTLVIRYFNDDSSGSVTFGNTTVNIVVFK